MDTSQQLCGLEPTGWKSVLYDDSLTRLHCWAATVDVVGEGD